MVKSRVLVGEIISNLSHSLPRPIPEYLEGILVKYGATNRPIHLLSFDSCDLCLWPPPLRLSPSLPFSRHLRNMNRPSSPPRRGATAMEELKDGLRLRVHHLLRAHARHMARNLSREAKISQLPRYFGRCLDQRRRYNFTRVLFSHKKSPAWACRTVREEREIEKEKERGEGAAARVNGWQFFSWYCAICVASYGSLCSREEREGEGRRSSSTEAPSPLKV